MKWKSVYLTEQQYKAEIVKGVLVENDINAVVVNKKDDAIKFGVFEVHVSVDHIIQAIKIIDDDISFT